MKDIHKLGLRGRLPTFIESFLADRTMQVRVGSTLSDLYDQEQGVPQGGVLSTTLFNIKINDIVKCLNNQQIDLSMLMIFVFAFDQKACEQLKCIYSKT